MGISITIKGIDEAVKMLKNKNERAINHLHIGFNKSAMHLQNEVKQSIAGHRAELTSVDTGRFLNSVDFNVGNMSATVFTDIEYAKFLEYGTRFITPRKHFFNTASREKSKVNEIVKNEIAKI